MQTVKNFFIQTVQKNTVYDSENMWKHMKIYENIVITSEKVGHQKYPKISKKF